MASIESLGLGSGVLTTDLVDKIITAEKEVSELRLDNRQELIEAKITAYGEIKSLMSTMQSAVNTLASPSAAGATKATSSNEDILTVTTSSTADPGSYNVEVLNTAKSHSLATGTFASFDEIIGTGNLTFSFGTNTYDGSGNISGQDVNTERQTKTITIDDSNRTLSGIRDAINTADMGVTATIINDGSGYRLLMTSSDTGAKNAMRIEATDDSGNLLTTGLSALAYNESQNGTGNLEQTSKGEDAQLQVNGLTITRTSNAVAEVIKGVTINLQSADVGTQVTVNVSADTDTLVENIQKFVDSYNELKQFVDDLSGYDADQQQAGLLLGDSTMRTIQGQIRSLISQPIAGLSGKFRSLTELGVNTDRNNDFLLEFDSSVFTSAVAQERSSIVGILAKSGVTTDSQITYVNDSINTKAGTYDIEITQMATQAKYTSASLALLDFASPVQIDASNDSFTINVNGKDATVSLTHGDYATGDALAKELALQINSDDTLVQFGHSVSVDYSSADRNFSITSNKYGAESQVYIKSVAGNTANTLGFSPLGAGTYEGVSLTTLNADAFSGKGAKTDVGSRPVDAETGINFQANNATFELDVDGAGPVLVTVSQNAQGQDLNGDGTFGDRLDTLQAIQSAIDATSLSGSVIASFNDNGYLQFETSAVGAARSIEIASTGASVTDTLLGLDATQGAKTNGKDPGLTFPSAVNFKVQVDGVETDGFVSVSAGTYLTGADLATEIQTQLAATLSTDPNFTGVVRGAETSAGSRDISTNIDFTTTNGGFTLNVSGNEQEIIVNSDSGDNIVDIQAALDTAYGAGVVTASLDGTGLKLSSVATGHNEFIEVVQDGRGAYTSSFADITTGYDFSAASQNATFTLTVDGININVDVNGDGTTGSNDEQSNLTVIQRALDTALVDSGEYSAGDVKAAVDGSGQLYFETVAKNGVKTAATYGSSASVQVSNLGGTAASALGLSAETVTNGYDGFGMSSARTFGYDLDPLVAYEYDAEKNLGSFSVQIGGEGTSIGFTELDADAIAFLGLQDVSNYSQEIPTGKDVAGKINGVEATGSGQFLRAVDGNVKATPGYYIGAESAGFDSPVVLDASNSTFRIAVDGIEAEVALNFPATYISGSALASALQVAINNTAELKAEGKTVKVEYTSDTSSFAYNKFGIISNTTGAESSVQIKDVSAGAATLFGFVTGAGDGETGKDQSGEIDDASGLRLKVTGGTIGNRGSVTYISGFGDQLKSLLDNYLSNSGGTIANKLSALDDDLDTVGEDRDKLEARISAQEARLKSQFLYNDALIQTLNTTLDYVKAQFEALNGTNKD
ncbi:flagellar filament capping protein FliD [Thalassolituus sp.]|uniref:flagellar filament capping protein FliD n=1 Tax=Thalassolituus sp. TaxID=2030822 RepID=UPI003513C6F3